MDFLFIEAEHRYKINGFVLSQFREAIALTVEEFAATIGWTASYQYRLEAGDYPTISLRTKDELIETFKRYGQSVE